MPFLNAGGPLRRIAHMGTAFLASSAVRGAIALVTSLVIARGLGRDAFGRWTLCTSVAAALTAALDLGFGVLLTREAAHGRRAIGRLVASAVGARLALFVPLAVLLVSAPTMFEAIPRSAADSITCLVAASIAYGCVAAAYRASPRWLLAIVSIEGVAASLQCGAIAMLVRRGATIDHLLWTAAAIQVVQFAAALALWRLFRPGDRLVVPTPRAAIAALRSAWPFALAGIVANGQARTAPLVLGSLAGTGELALFGVASRIEATARRVPFAALGGALPVFSSEAARGKAAAVRSHFDRVLLVFAASAATVLVLGAVPIVRVTYGLQFAAAAQPLMWAGFGLLPVLFNASSRVYLNATGRERAAVRWSAVAWAVQAALCLALVPHWGATGAMLALGAGEAAVCLPLRRASRERLQADANPGIYAASQVSV